VNANLKKEFRVWKIRNDVTEIMIAKETGYTNVLVNKVVNGQIKNVKVVDAFVKRGCPIEFFGEKYLPNG